jgi:hypothetical protein
LFPIRWLNPSTGKAGFNYGRITLWLAETYMRVSAS